MTHGKRISGFTLIELLIAIVVLSVALAGMIPVLVQTIRGNNFGGLTSKAANYSLEKLEELRASEFSTIAPGSDTLDGGLFSRTWGLDTACSICGPDLVGIEVATQWTDRTGTHVARYYTVQANVK